MNFLLSSAYIPPIPYFSLFFTQSPIFWDPFEHFQKQSFRNRTHILSPQGLLALSVPIQKTSRRNVPMREVKISHEFNWQKLHWMSLQSCYRRSSYFEFYEDEMAPFFEKTYTYIWDLNQEWFHFLGKNLSLEIRLGTHLVTDYQKNYEESWVDLRNGIHPKQNWGIYGESYPQVFNSIGQFYEELSILDLLFNQGKGAVGYLNSLSILAEITYSKWTKNPI